VVFEIANLLLHFVGYCNYNNAAHTYDQNFACLDYFKLSSSGRLIPYLQITR
jgi:hypothetical protein